MGTEAQPTLRELTVTWGDPAIGLEQPPHLDGVDFVQKIADGEIPGAPIGAHIGMQLTDVERRR